MPKAPSESSPLSARRLRWRALLASPTIWHYVTLAVGLLTVSLLQRGQWFFYDEWAFIEPHGAGLLDPHNEHFSLAPMLIYRVMIATVGLNHYWPYALLMALIHLGAAHLVWRIAVRLGANAWVATLLAALFIGFGGGYENILWAFQIGFVGAVAVGLLAFWLALDERQDWWWHAIVVVIGCFSLTWSGTAIPVFIATAALLLIRHGWLRALVFAAVGGAVYLTWYFTYGRHSLASDGVPDPVSTVRFMASVVYHSITSLVPVTTVGVFLLLAAGVLWLVRVVRRRETWPGAVPALLLIGAIVVFIGMTAVGRSSFGIESSLASRYFYLVVLLALPAIALGVSALVAARRWTLPVVATLVVLLTGYQVNYLAKMSSAWSARSQGTRALMCAAIELHIDGTAGLDPAKDPDPQWAPDLQYGELVELYETGRISACPTSAYTSADLTTERTALRIG